ncbi:MAG TPA: DUF4058 family protein [Gemmataceae bacterium]|nr:DUF4058 family protein [Gemmataceae bacterium]
MKSPFLGMDPYIEVSGIWKDFHNHLVEKIGESLTDAAPERYVVRTGERSYLVLVESEEKVEHYFEPDVKVTTPTQTKKQARKKDSTAVAELAEEAEPTVLRAFIEDDHREKFIEVYEATKPEHRLVTTVEVLSPSNKRPSSTGRDLYLRKRQSLMLEGVNLVEIDLLRGGERMPMLDRWPASPYTLMVARARKPYACLVWQGHYQKPLPTIRVPLLKPDPDVSLDLQPMIDTIYRRWRYAQSIDYAKPLKPPLKADEAAWLKRQLRARQEQA